MGADQGRRGLRRPTQHCDWCNRNNHRPWEKGSMPQIWSLVTQSLSGKSGRGRREPDHHAQNREGTSPTHGHLHRSRGILSNGRRRWRSALRTREREECEWIRRKEWEGVTVKWSSVGLQMVNKGSLRDDWSGQSNGKWATFSYHGGRRAIAVFIMVLEQ
jgi:hypothetical protein